MTGSLAGAVAVAVVAAAGVGDYVVRDYVAGSEAGIEWIGCAEEPCFVGGAAGQLTVVAVVAVAEVASDATSARGV